LDKGWIAITDFYVRQKNYQKALFYVNKALAIDNQNQLYWKRYATINKQMDLKKLNLALEKQWNLVIMN
jgi:tetratricopeptide (TPR) repeat protein